MQLSFKDMQESDLPEVKKIYDWHIAHSTATFHTGPVETEELKEFIYTNHPLYNSYLILADGEVAGYCLLTNYKKRQAYDRTAEITLYLAPTHIRKGIGKIALKHLEDRAKQNGLKTLLAGITEGNDGSIALFSGNGYDKCAHYKNVGEKFGQVLDVVYYQKEI